MELVGENEKEQFNKLIITENRIIGKTYQLSITYHIKMKLLLFVVMCIIVIGTFNSEARIMGGGRRPWRVTAAPRFKPWDSPHRYDYDEEDREFWEEQDGAMKEKYQNSRYGDRGCVGLCLYNKMHGIKDESSGDEPKKAEVKITPVSKQINNVTSKPCVGLCQYYKSLGMPYPFANEKRVFYR